MEYYTRSIIRGEVTSKTALPHVQKQQQQQLASHFSTLTLQMMLRNESQVISSHLTIHMSAHNSLHIGSFWISCGIRVATCSSQEEEGQRQGPYQGPCLLVATLRPSANDQSYARPSRRRVIETWWVMMAFIFGEVLYEKGAWKMIRNESALINGCCGIARRRAEWGVLTPCVYVCVYITC